MDVHEFQTLYREKFGSIYHYVYSKVGNREEAEDLTAEVFLKAARNINYESNSYSIREWLFLVARSTIADYWRRHFREPTSSLDELLEIGWEGPPEEELSATDNTTDNTTEGQVQRILEALPWKYREVLKCRFLLNLSIKATASRMGLTEANVKVLQFRALKRAAALNLFDVAQQVS
jgi:RNA polymerase sigma-70 factor, ECF subfamily